MNDLDRQQRLFVASMAEKLRLGGIGRRQPRHGRSVPT
jgi:hypothetical protein